VIKIKCNEKEFIFLANYLRAAFGGLFTERSPEWNW